jgi:MFS family permease
MATRSSPDQTLSAGGAPNGRRLYRVGSLTYTRGMLWQVMFWMLWGDFCFVIMESLVPSVVPLQLRWVGAGDTLVGALTNSLPSFVGILMNPIVGVQSDRHRGRLGRRRPFLLWCTPPVVISLVLLGAAKPAGGYLQRITATLGGGWPVATWTILWIGICVTVFVVFNTYILQVYQFLFADVIPEKIMGSFVGIYRAIGALGALAFNRWVLGWAQTYTLHIYLLAALLYASSFMLLVWRVKEGSYPPPPELRPGRGRLALLGDYFRECFRHRFYLNVYCLPFFFWSAIVPFATFVIFFATSAGQPGYANTIGLTLMEFGHVKGWTFLVQVPIFFIVGPMVDRFHPVRVAMVGLCLTSVSYFACFWLIRGPTTLLLWWLVNQGASAVFLGAYLALLPRLFPREKYGQFFSANQIVGFSGVVISPILCGVILETIRDYRYIFAWCGACAAIGFVASITLFVQWRRLGGDRAYIPPGMENRDDASACGELA